MVQNGVVLHGTLNQVLPLSLPSKKIVISNVSPLLPNSLLERELARHGKLVSSITNIPLGSKSPLLKHVVSFRRQVYMIPNDGGELDLSLTFTIDGAHYIVFATSDTVMKCFGCGAMGHLIRACPLRPKHNESDGATAAGAEDVESVEGDPSTASPVDTPSVADSSAWAAPPLELLEFALLNTSGTPSTEQAGLPKPTTSCSEWAEFVAVEYTHSRFWSWG